MSHVGCRCSVAVKMQRWVLKVLCSTLLLLAGMSTVYSAGNDTGMCVTDEGDSGDNTMNCSWTRVSDLCTVVENVAEGGGEGDSGNDSNTSSSPEFSQAKFDMSSFIGGIILVLCLQAGGFLAMRFLKSKEQSSYDPIEQPQ
ncbi:hypothetical protein INR49_023554 [Caranx melampygus]|nr:hypothetical protein INR49_023554 [Caranx melampygus]